MASITKRRNPDGSTSWDPMVRVVGYPTMIKSFRIRLGAGLWAARMQARAKGASLATAKGLTFGMLCDEALPRLKNPSDAAFSYWRENFGDLRLEKLTPDLIAINRDSLLGAKCRGFKHETTKPPSSATVRN